MIEVNLSKKKEITIDSLYQWDYGQVVKVIGIEDPSNIEIHVGNSSSTTYVVKSITVYNGYFTFQIPDSLLQVAKAITAVVYYDSGTEGKSKKIIEFRVRGRIRPADYITPDDENYDYVVPVGGSTGQVLAKASDADGDTEWVDQTGGGGSSFDINSLTEENNIADGDYMPFYDTSATAQRKTLWSNIKAKLKAYFDTLYSTISHTHTKSQITDFPTIPSKVSDLTNDSGYITSYTETDPTVPSWAKQVNKPTYTYSEVGASASNHNHSGVYQPTETGKGLSTNDYTNAEKNKLAGISSGAEANVQSDWNQTDTTADDYIKNKPTIPSAYTLPTASPSTLGGVKVGNNLSIDANGVLNFTHQDITGKENTSNKVASISSSSTDTQYPSAKCVYDLIGDVETLLGGLL